MEIRENQLTRNGWEAFADRHAALLQQRWDYGEASPNVRRFQLTENRKTLGLAQVLLRPVLGRWAISTCFTGPICAANHRAQATKLLIDQLTPGLRLIMPPDDAPPPAMTRIMTPSTLALLPLSDEGEMRKKLHGKWRNRLIKAEAEPLRISQEKGTPPAISPLLDQETRQRALRKYRGLPISFIKRLAEAQPSQMRLFGARRGNTRCASMLFYKTGTTVTYLIGWSDEHGRQISAHNRLMWQAMTNFAAQGASQIDLGTINTHAAPGLARFKLGTGAKPVKLGSTWAKIALRGQPDGIPTGSRSKNGTIAVSQTSS